MAVGCHRPNLALKNSFLRSLRFLLFNGVAASGRAGFFVDSISLFCWTPGIVSIALTNRRQRLGDLVADTVVVETRSMKSAGSHLESQKW